MPVNSQKFPKNVVPTSSGATYIEPQEANDANHLEETIPTEQIKKNLKDILGRCGVSK